MNNEYTRPAPDELANMMRSGYSPHNWRHEWRGTPWSMAADYLEELAALHKANAILTLLRHGTVPCYSMSYFQTHPLSSVARDCMVVLHPGVHPPAREDWNKEDSITGIGNTFAEAVLDAASKIDHPKVQAILNNSAVISSLP